MTVRWITVAAGAALVVMALAAVVGESSDDPMDVIAAGPSVEAPTSSKVDTIEATPSVSLSEYPDYKGPHRIVAVKREKREPMTPSFQADATARRIENPDGHFLEFGVPKVIGSNGTLAGRRDAPQREAGAAAYDHGSWEELYFENESSIHQMFRFHERIEGEAKIRIPFRTDRKAYQAPTAITFDGRDGGSGFWYSEAYALDSAGMIEQVPVNLVDGALEILLPAAVLARAQYPLLIDPVVGTTPIGVSASSQMWRNPNISIVYDSVNAIYVMAWHENTTLLPTQNIIEEGDIFVRALRVVTATVDVDDQIELGTPFGVTAASTQVPDYNLTTDPGVAGGGSSYSPRLAFNPYATGTQGRFMVVWCEGSDVYLHAPTDINVNGVAELAIYNDPWPIQAFPVFRRFDVAAADGAVTFRGAATLLDPAQDDDGDGLIDEDPVDNPPFDDDGDGLFDEDPPGIGGISGVSIKCYIDVTHDSEGYIVVWQETSDPIVVHLEAIGLTEWRHWWWTRARPLSRRVNNDGTMGTPVQALGAQKFRPFLSSGSSAGDFDPGLTLVGDLPAPYNGKVNYEYVPLDMTPRATSLIWPGPDGIMHTADDGDGESDDGSLIVWSLTSLVFNVPKSRIRARHVPEGASPTGLNTIVFDVLNETGTFAIRPSITWTLSQQADDPTTPAINEQLVTSHYTVAWQDVQEIAWQGSVRAVELFGSIEMRLVEEYGYPSGSQINVATLSATDKYLWPTVSGNYETEQIYIAYTRTDATLFNPVTHARAYFPKGFTFLDFENIMAPIATLYPSGIAQSFNATEVDPGNSDTANHHLMAVGVEDDFASNYVRRYKYTSTPNVGFPKLYVLTGETTATGENPDDDPAPPQLNLNFSTTSSAVAPANQTFLIGNVGGNLSKLEWTAAPNQVWVTVNGEATSTGGPLDPGTTEAITVSVDPTFLTDGNYTATINLSSPLATNSPLPVIINLQVGTGIPPGTPGLTASPNPINLIAPLGGPNPPPQSFNISFIETAPGDVGDWTLSLDSITPAGSAWVTLLLPPGGLPLDNPDQPDSSSVTVTLIFDMSDLTLTGAGPGSYAAVLRLESPGTAGAPAGNGIDDIVTVNSPTITINLTATGGGAEICSNGIDDDGDGDIDCADSDCFADSFCTGGVGEICTDGFDNDGDSDVDCDDADCAGDPACTGGPGGGGGGGGNGTRGGGGASGFLPGCSSEAGASQHGGTSSAVLALILAVILGLAVRRLT